MKRRKMSRRGSKRLFAKTSAYVHKKNMPAPRKMPMRGGIRL